MSCGYSDVLPKWAAAVDDLLVVLEIVCLCMLGQPVPVPGGCVTYAV